ARPAAPHHPTRIAGTRSAARGSAHALEPLLRPELGLTPPALRGASHPETLVKRGAEAGRPARPGRSHLDFVLLRLLERGDQEERPPLRERSLSSAVYSLA